MATLEELSIGPASRQKPNVIFVHGLGGHPRTTWMHNPADHATLWPEWVAADSGCPVWLLEYDAALSGWTDGAMPLPKQGTTLLELIVTEPKLKGAPLVMVGHSLGGLVIKTALSNALTLGVPRYRGFVEQLKGVVFVATPHFGSDLASLVDTFRLLARSNQQVGNLRANDAYLANLNTQFRAQQQRTGLSVRVFAESRGVTTKKRWLWLRGPTVRVVSDMSSDPSVSGETAVSLPEDHFSICKPRSQKAQIHKSLLGFLADLQDKLRDESTVAAPPPIVLPADPVATADAATVPPRSDDPGPAVPRPTRLGFASCGLDDPDARMLASVCVVTDDIEGLVRAVGDIAARIDRNHLVPEAAKQRMRKLDLADQVADDALRALWLDGLSTTDFSAYLYYLARDAGASLPAAELKRRLFVQPLAHRLRKKSEVITTIHGDGTVDLAASLAAAVELVRSESGRDLAPIETGGGTDRASRTLVQLARLVARLSVAHLAAPTNEAAATAFDHLRNKLRFAMNVATGAVHTRDRNPLP